MAKKRVTDWAEPAIVHLDQCAGRQVMGYFVRPSTTLVVTRQEWCVVPQRGCYANFLMKDYVVLHDMGNEDRSHLTPLLQRKLGLNLKASSLAVHKETGHVFQCEWTHEGDETCCAYLDPLPSSLIVPAPYRKGLLVRVDTKRPWGWWLHERELHDFMNREIGYRDLRRSLGVKLYVDQITVCVEPVYDAHERINFQTVTHDSADQGTGKEGSVCL